MGFSEKTAGSKSEDRPSGIVRKCGSCGSGGKRLPGRAADGSKLRVLLVGNDLDSLAAARAVLGDFDVTLYRSAKQGLEAHTQRRFHVICADWRGPPGDGVAFLRSVAALGPVGCLLLTSYPQDVRINHADRKLIAVLPRPYQPESLLDKIRHYASVVVMKRATQDLRVAMEEHLGWRG